MPAKKTTKKAEAVEETVTPEVAGKCRHGASRIWIATAVIVLAQLLSTAYFSDVAVKKSLEATKNFEYDKVGGKETFDLLNKAQRLQLKGQLDQIKNFIEQSEKTAPSADNAATGTTAATDTSAATADASKTMSKDEIAAIEKTAFFEGDANARVIAVEYTDPECPFCIRQAKDGVLPKLLQNYAGKVRIAHKVFRAVPHPGAEPKSLALLCVGKIAGGDAYNKYYQAIMDRSSPEKVMPVDSLLPLAKEQGLNAKAFSACYDAKETVSQYDANTTEGTKYGVQGTPGTLIVDTETGKYELIAGAYPYETFQSAVDKFLK